MTPAFELENGGRPFVEAIGGRYACSIKARFYVVRQFGEGVTFEDGTVAPRTEYLCDPWGYASYDEAESAMLKAFPLEERV